MTIRHSERSSSRVGRMRSVAGGLTVTLTISFPSCFRRRLDNLCRKAFRVERRRVVDLARNSSQVYIAIGSASEQHGSLDERVDIDLDTRIAALPKPKRGLTALRARQIPWKHLKTIRLA